MNQLVHERKNLLSRISEAAQQGESQVVLDTTERLGKVEFLIQRYEQLVSDIRDLNVKPRNRRASEINEKSSEALDAELDLRLHLDGKRPRALGKRVRMAYPEKLGKKGITLQQVKGTIYKTKSGQRVGIAVATERQPERWFLGLPADNFDRAILLCQREKGDIVEIHLPESFFDQYGSQMSQSRGQVEFNVSRRGNGYVLLVPGTDGINTSGFSRDYAAFS